MDRKEVVTIKAVAAPDRRRRFALLLTVPHSTLLRAVSVVEPQAQDGEPPAAIRGGNRFDGNDFFPVQQLPPRFCSARLTLCQM